MSAQGRWARPRVDFRGAMPCSGHPPGDGPQEVHGPVKPYVRLTQPLVRGSRTEPLRPATWDEALARAAGGFTAAKAAQGPASIGVFSCSKSTNEVNFAVQKLARAVLGTNNIDSCNRT